MTREKFVSLFFIVLLLFVVYQVFRIFSPFFQSIFWAGILAYGFFPLHKALKKKLKLRDTVAAVFMTLLIFVAVVPPVIWMVSTLADQAVDFYHSASDFVSQGKLEQLVEKVRLYPWVQQIESNYFRWEPIERDTTEWILSSARKLGNFAVGQVRMLTRNIFMLCVHVFFTFSLIFVFLRDGEKIYQFVYRNAPLEDKNKKSIFNEVTGTFSAVIRGQMLTALVQAALAGMIFWILGVPLPLFFASVTFMTSMIPVLGASFVWLPMVILFLINDAMVKAIILFLVGIFGISLVDNIIKPALIGEKTKLPYFLLFFGILGGLAVYGFIGIFIAPVVLSLFFAVIKIYEEKYLS